MKFIISIEHPAWAHQFRYIIQELQKHGHDVKVLAVNKDRDLELLDIFNIKYEIISNSDGKNVLDKSFVFISTTIKIFLKSLKFKPDIFIGRASPMMAINSFLFQKPHIIFEDTERAKISLFFCKLFSRLIITPHNFLTDLGKKQMRVDVYKEIFYLHPKRFKPDESILRQLELTPESKFIILRFVAWDASHDFAIGGLSIKDKRKIINTLSKKYKIFISSEKELPEEFKKFQLNISPEKLHDLIYYANLVFTEGASVASESAVLGTHSIYVNPLSAGTTDEQEEKYQLVYNFADMKSDKALKKAWALLQKQNLKKEGKKKRQLLLVNKFDPTTWFVWFIENYPNSEKIMKENPTSYRDNY